jgi:hypothetical protein
VSIAWGTLAAIAVVAAAAALTVVLLFAFAIVGLSTSSADRVAGVDDGLARGGRSAGTAIAVLCLLAAGLIVCFSLYLIIA